MKRRTQRIFISLLAFFIAWFAIANAYTFEVVNWSPFWVLNLQKLILKGWTTSTWIILDWKEYVIKIDPEHENNGWQIRVYEICDESGNNCREVSSLYTGTQGVPWPQWNTWADGVWIQEISSEKVWKTTTVTVTYTNWETLSFDILDWNDGTGVNWWWIAFTNNSHNNHICRKSWDAVTCNGLKLSTYPQNNRLCYVKDNVLYCDQENLFDELSGRIVDVNDWTLMIYVDGSTYKTFSANQTGSTTINISPTWLEWNICVKNASGFIRCDTSVKIWTMVNGRICTYSDWENKINCNTSINNPWSAIITLQTKSWDVVNRSGSFDVNQTTNKTITIPSWGGWVPWQKWDKWDPWENWVSVTNAYIDWNNIVFELSDNSTITLENALRKWDQWPKWDTWAVWPQWPKWEKWEKWDKWDPWDWASIPWNSWQRCKYICDRTEWQGWKQVCVSWHVACYESEPTCQWSCNEWSAWMLSGSAWWRCRYGAVVNGTTISWNMWDLAWNIKTWIICTETAPTWDSLWQSIKITANGTTSSENLLTPKNTNQDLYLSGDIWNDGAITIKTLWASNAARENTVSIYQHWVAIWELPNKTAGLWVHWPISVWKYMLSSGEQSAASHWGQCTSTTYNTISIYASGAGADEHFEILWTPRILIWVTNGAYMYFVWDWSPNIWINTQNTHATLNIDGSIRIGNCSNNNTCNSASAWEIKYYEKNNKWYFVWCRKTGTSSYERVILSDWTETTGANNIWNSCNPPVVPYSSDVYGSQGMLMQQQANCQW